MEEDPLMSPSVQKRNIIESVSGICNLYAKSSTVDMYTGAHDAQFIPDHQSKNPSSSPTAKDTMASMKKSFANGCQPPMGCTLSPH
jgi:hypothetical protein